LSQLSVCAACRDDETLFFYEMTFLHYKTVKKVKKKKLKKFFKKRKEN
jgi:hypothetical protein